jgi:hypothetical protein
MRRVVVSMELGMQLYSTTIGSNATGYAATLAPLETSDTTARPGCAAVQHAGNTLWPEADRKRTEDA